MTTFLGTDTPPEAAWEGDLEPLGPTLRGGPTARVSLGRNNN